MPKTALEMLVAANPADAERWHGLVSNSSEPDVYYLPAYALASAEIERSEPVAIVVGSDHCRFLAPLLVRNMSAEVNNSGINSRIDWSDASSPYGYGGLLRVSNGQSIDACDLSAFFDDLQTWCSTRDLVCCVLRLHPLMRQDEWFKAEEPKLRIRSRGLTTAIDLEKWDEERDRPSSMRKGRRSDLGLAQRTLRVTWTSGGDSDAESGLHRFSALYEQAIEDRRANEFYRFSSSYFSRLAALGSHLGIAFAWLGDQLAGASIFLAGSDYAHYHLACANEIGMEHGAGTLLVVEGARWARKHGCRLLHLGGGLTPGDSLEDFKRSFGGETYQYTYLVYVADLERFEQLCRISDAPWPYLGK